MDIPSQYNPKEVEDKHYKKWFSSGYFNAKVMPGRKPFCIVIPPPNVTGILHMGHALNNTIQDVLVRYKRMQGFESLWMPGTDHAGIATQNMVEKSLAKEGLRKEDLGREEFTRRLWDWTDKHGTTILNQLKKLGASCDWDRTRFTMDSAYQDAVAEVFIRLAQKGLIYRGTRLINWCPRCKTALSDEESPHREIDGYLYYLKYPVKARGQKQDIPGHVVVATTRPETMLGDTAVAVHPKDERYRWLKDAIVTLPLVNRELKVVEDEAIDPAFGTGVVKVTPAHDPVDFALGKKYGLEFINIFNHDATLNENVPKDFARMERHDARKKVLEELAKIGLYDDKEKKPYKVNAGHCYRCHTLIEPWLSPQWFVNMKPLAAPAIRAVENDDVRFTPVRWKKVYLNWMNNIQDWCISRQIWWGHPIPAWYCLKCNCDAGKIIKTVLPGNSPQAKYVIADGAKYVISKERPEKCPDCGAGEFIKDPDVLDTWFSSWLWPFATFYWPFNHAGQGLAAAGQGKNLTSSEKILKREREVFKKELEYFYPTSTLVTASEILFFWVARMIMAGFEFQGRAPFSDVVIHGTVRDAKGIKMSKSLGNIIDPLEVIEKFGADSLRFSLMMIASSGADVYLSDEKFLVGRNFCNKIWNATRFLLLKIKEKNITIDNLELSNLEDVDEWILDRSNLAIERINKNLVDFRINDAAKAIYDFFWHDFCDWYIEIVKDDFTADKAKALIYTLLNAMKLLHPIMPFVTEEVFQAIKSHTALALDETIMTSRWPERKNFGDVPREDSAVNRIIEVIENIRNIKAELGIPQKKIPLEVSINKINRNADEEIWRKHQNWIKRLAWIDRIEFRDTLSRVIYRTPQWEFNLVSDEVDTQGFKAALDKKIGQAQPVLNKTLAKLNNEGFVKNADPEVVESEKEKSAQLSGQLKRLTELREAFK